MSLIVDNSEIPNNSSRGIMYHSRMRILKSREESTRKRNHGGGGGENGTSGGDTHLSLIEAQEPCTSEALVPPIELMTRPQAFRHACWKYHQASTRSRVRRMTSLTKREDPIIKQKRDEILSRIRAAEMASERVRRESRKRAERILNSDHSGSGGTLVNSESHMETMETDNTEHSGSSTFHFETGFSNNNQKHQRNLSIKKELQDSEDESDVYPDGFSFIADWGESNKKASRKKNRKMSLKNEKEGIDK